MSLDNRHLGKIAAILGGGPSLKKDLKRVPPGAILFAVNHYASHLGIVADYAVYNDAHTAEIIKPDGAKLVSRFRDTADVYVPFDTGVLSAICAARLARRMGCSPIILCGCDCTGTHFKHQVSSDWYLEHWKRENPAGIRVVSGPLKNIFGSIGHKVEADPVTMTVTITENKVVQLDDDRSVHFVTGRQEMSIEKANAALAAGIAIKEK